MGVAIVSGAREPMGVEAMTMQPAEMTDEQLNAAVAVEVMGWERDPRDDGWRDRNFVFRREWHPVTDYAAAFEVVERMRGAGTLKPWAGFKRWEFTVDGDDEWYAHVRRLGGPSGRAINKSLPRAISEAALQAVRTEM